MDPRFMKPYSDHLFLGCTMVAAGSAVGLWLPPGTVLLVLAAVWSRIAWIENAADRAAARPWQRRQFWAALGWAVAAGMALTVVAPITLTAGAVALVLALRQADDLALDAARSAVSPPRARPDATERDSARTAAVPRRPD
jgi:uncharacterized membrane protein